MTSAANAISNISSSAGVSLPLILIRMGNDDAWTAGGITRKVGQITTAGASTAAVTEKVCGENVSAVCPIVSLASKAKNKDKRNIG